MPENRLYIGIDEHAIERFWLKVDRTGDCWLWLASTNHQGYGKFWLSGHTIQAHRVAYTIENGPIPEGLTLDHLCRTRACQRPSHLEAVTIQENLRRSPNRPEKRTHCPRGHAFAGENLRVVRSTGERRCRECDNKRSREWARARYWSQKRGAA